MSNGCDLLVVAAFAPELSGLHGLLGDHLAGQVGGHSVAAHAVGIGLAASTSGAGARLGTLRPRAVALVGTAGAYRGAGLRRFDVVVGQRVLLVEPAAVEGHAAFPEAMAREVETHAAMRTALAASGARAADIATTLAVTTDDALAARLERATGAGVEHLEAFGVATACAEHGTPFVTLLGVANVVGSSGRAEWREGHVAAGEAAARMLARWLEAGAPGLPPG